MNQQDGLEKTLIAEAAMADAFMAIFGMTRAAFSEPHSEAETENGEGGQ